MATIAIDGQAALTTALGLARGGETFVLAAGNYDKIIFSNRKFDVPITIISADTNNRAALGSILISGSSGVVFRDVEIGSALAAGEPAQVTNAATVARNSSNLTFDNVFVRGSMDGDSSNDRMGLSFTNSSGIKITNSKFEQLSRGAIFGSSNDILVQNSTFMHLRSDGLNFADVQNVTIDGNYIGSFQPVGADHPDAIQFWTRGTTRSSSDIKITNNQIQFGGGAGAQGIFMRDETNNLPYKRVTIDNNMVYVVAGYNGLAIGNGEDVTVTNNTVVSKPNDKYRLRISLGTIEGGTVANNVSDIMLTNPATNMTIEENLVLQDDASKIKLIPNLSNGPATTYRDLVIEGKGYQPVSGAGLSITPAPEVVAAAAAAQAAESTPAGTLLLDMRFANGGVDASKFGSDINGIKAADVDESGTEAAYKLGGTNYIEVVRTSASQLYNLEAFTMSFDLKRATAGASGDGHIMRIHNSWYVAVEKGELSFQYNNAAGTSYKATSTGAKLTDLKNHEIDITFDSEKKRVEFYVDGRSVGGGAIDGATRGAQSWGLAVGNPFGESFKGEVGGIQIVAGAKAAAEISSNFYEAPLAYALAQGIGFALPSLGELLSESSPTVEKTSLAPQLTALDDLHLDAAKTSGTLDAFLTHS